MIEFNNIKENAKKAFESGKLFEFLTGRNGYDLPVLDAQVDVPTDWTRIIPHGIYALYEESKDVNILNEYQNAIIKAINGSAFDIWCAVNILYFQIDHEMMKKSPFVIDKNVYHDLKDRIISNEDELKKEYPYGKNNQNMYEDICRLNHNFKDDWGYGFLG